MFTIEVFLVITASDTVSVFGLIQMKLSWSVSVAILLLALSSLQLAFGLRFVIDREECFSHNVQYEWDVVHASFVVIKSDSPWRTDDGVDLVVSGNCLLICAINSEN